MAERFSACHLLRPRWLPAVDARAPYPPPASRTCPALRFYPPIKHGPRYSRCPPPGPRARWGPAVDASRPASAAGFPHRTCRGASYAFTRLCNIGPHYSRCPPPGPRARRLPAVDALAPHPPPASRTCPGTSYAFTRLLNIGPRYSPLTALPLLRALVGCPSLMRWPAPAAVAVPVAYRIRPPPSRVAPAQLAFIFTLPTTNLSSNSPPRV
ncbi:hypothetical protein B0H14DRAFT_3517168 [Mycena olivaceomarginata]|nr:hypothetical protein B0H14DRAFT_3517168 [Mycena olivaceomarginata]